MDISHISGGAFWSPTVVIFLSIALVAFVVFVLLIPILNKFDSKADGAVLGVCLGGVTFLALVAGLISGMGVNIHSANTNFAEKLNSEYGLTTEASYSNVQTAANFSTIVVFSDGKSKFEVRPHIEGDKTMTFFRVDNGAEIKPKS